MKELCRELAYCAGAIVLLIFVVTPILGRWLKRRQLREVWTQRRWL